MAGKATAGIVGASATTPNSYASVVNNGQLIGTQTSSAYFPKNYGGGISATPAASPVTVPPNVGYGVYNVATAPVGSGAAPAGTGTAQSTQNRGSYKGGVVGSPAMWALGLMAFGALWLRYVHWRKPGRKAE